MSLNKSTEQTVTYESRAGVAIITINRPGKRNAINSQVVIELCEAWKRFNGGEDRVAVLTGSGNEAFTGGADLGDVPENISRCIPGMGVEVSKPVIVAVSGWCIGAGLVLVQMADLCIAAENSQFGYPEAKIGLSGGAVSSLAARIPHKIAMELMLMGDPISATRALDAGLVNQVVPVGQQLDIAMQWAGRLADNAPRAVALLKDFAGQVLPKGPSELAAIAARQINAVWNSRDRFEGVASFKEKRKPKFTGE